MRHYYNHDVVDMSKEVFKQIPKYPRYEVSNYGRVRRIKTGRIIKQRLNGNGYYEVQLTINRKNHHAFIHRLVAYTFMKNPDPEHMDVVNHMDENPSNNHLDNLEFCDREWNATWGTAIDRTRQTKLAHNNYVAVYVIRKSDLKVFKFKTIADASKFTGAFGTIIRRALDNWKYKVEGDYVYCLPSRYSQHFAEKIVNNSLGYHYQRYDGIYVIDVETRESMYFSSLKRMAQMLHISDRKVATLIDDPLLANPYEYVFCQRKDYSKDYVDYLLKVYTYDNGQSIPIAGLNIKTGEIRHFDSIKQAEHELNNQSVQPYMSGKVKSAKGWVFCKEYKYSRALLEDRAKQANPNEVPDVIVLNCKTGNTTEFNIPVSQLAKHFEISVNTIRNQLNHGTLAMDGNQFIYKDTFNDKIKNLYVSAYKKKNRGKAVYAININTLRIKKYPSATQASKELGISRDRILSTISRGSNQTGGYVFCYETYYSKLYMYRLAYEGKYGKEGFPVVAIDKDNNQKLYPAVKEAAKELGTNKNNIFRAVRTGGRSLGYHWVKQNRDKYLQSLLEKNE